MNAVARRRWAGAVLLAGLACLGLSACPRKDAQPPAPPPASSAVLIVASDLWGYLGPCGCSENMRGGIGRAAFQVAEGRKGGGPVFFIDGGDSLFGKTEFPEAQIPQEERKARALADAFRMMGLVTRGAGERDDARGADFRKALQLPDQPNASVKSLDAGGRKLAVVTATTDAELLAVSKEARDGGARFVLALLHQSMATAQQAAAQPGLAADLVIATHVENELAAEENRLSRGAVPVAQLQSKGRSLLRIDLSFADGPAAGARFEWLRTQADAEKERATLDQRIALLDAQINAPGLPEQTKALYRQKAAELAARRQAQAVAPLPKADGKNAFAPRFLPLDASLPDLPEARALIDGYHRDVAKLNLVWAQQHGRDCPAPPKGQAGYVGNASCAECHAEAQAFWEKTKHAHAYATLEQAGRQYDLECVSCHVTGADQPGGVCRVDKVEGRKDVGCENCHGPGSLHAEDPSPKNILARPVERDCAGCHNPENSPHFRFDAYLPQILGPGHGAKKP